MCNMAAYAGTGPAVPVLLRMLEKQEGLWGGHFTGISTIHEGRIHTRKVCGDVAELRRQTDAESLPGSIGIAHSRSPGNIPLATWAHPFAAGEGKIAYCANGIAGIFEGKQGYPEHLARLAQEGVTLLSASPTPAPPMPVTADGQSVHVTEINAHLLARAHLQGGLEMIGALRQMFQEAPSEIAALALSELEPDRVSGLRFNQPLMWNYGPDGMYLASCAMAFPETVTAPPALIPPCSTLVMTKAGLRIEPMKNFASLLHQEDGFYKAGILMEEMLAGGKALTVIELSLAVRKLFEAGKSCCSTYLVYIWLLEKMASGKVVREDGVAAGSLPGAGAPEWRFRFA